MGDDELNEQAKEYMQSLLATAEQLPCDPKRPLKLYQEKANDFLQRGMDAGKHKDMHKRRLAYVNFMRYADMVVYTIPKHPGYSAQSADSKRNSTFVVKIVEKMEQWKDEIKQDYVDTTKRKRAEAEKQREERLKAEEAAAAAAAAAEPTSEAEDIDAFFADVADAAGVAAAAAAAATVAASGPGSGLRPAAGADDGERLSRIRQMIGHVSSRFVCHVSSRLSKLTQLLAHPLPPCFTSMGRRRRRTLPSLKSCALT
eukprot:SAG11_NODE_2137_length_3766_cov_2.253613_1_plen_257_part_00